MVLTSSTTTLLSVIMLGCPCSIEMYGGLQHGGSRKSGKMMQFRELTLLDSVHMHKSLVHGHKTQYWCCQDAKHKAKEHLSKKDDAKRRDYVGMVRYDCDSKLSISSRDVGERTLIHVYLRHHKNHREYYDVQMPPAASDIIRDHLETATPHSLVTVIQERFVNVTAAQVHTAWTRMSEVLWRRQDDPVKSAVELLKEYEDDVDYFEINVEEGVVMVAFGLKRILHAMKGRVVEIATDATCELNIIG